MCAISTVVDYGQEFVVFYTQSFFIYSVVY